MEGPYLKGKENENKKEKMKKNRNDGVPSKKRKWQLFLFSGNGCPQIFVYVFIRES